MKNHKICFRISLRMRNVLLSLTALVINTMLGCAGVHPTYNTTAYNSTISGPQEMDPIEQLRQRYGCIGTAEIPQLIRNETLARNLAGNRAREDYIEKCLGVKPLLPEHIKKVTHLEFIGNLAVAYSADKD